MRLSIIAVWLNFEIDTFRTSPLPSSACRRVRGRASGCAASPRAALSLEQFARQIQRNPVDVHAKQLRKAQIPKCHQHQRREEMAAELTVSRPRAARLIEVKGERSIRPAGRSKIECCKRWRPEDHVPVERGPVNAQRGQRGVLELAERQSYG